MIKGRAQFDGIALAKLVVTFLHPHPRVVAKAAFVRQATGRTHGVTTNQRWSPAVMQKLQELAHLMELDLARLHFSDIAEAADAPSTSSGGLLEHITGLGEDAPSI